MKYFLSICIIFCSLNAQSQSLKGFEIGMKPNFDNFDYIEQYTDRPQEKYGYRFTKVDVSVGNLNDVENLFAISDKDTLVYQIYFSGGICDDMEAAKDFRIAVENRYSIKFPNVKTETEVQNTDYTNLKIVIKKYNRVCTKNQVEYRLVTKKGSIASPENIGRGIVAWTVDFMITDKELEKKHIEYSKEQEKIRKEKLLRDNF